MTVESVEGLFSQGEGITAVGGEHHLQVADSIYLGNLSRIGLCCGLTLN